MKAVVLVIWLFIFSIPVYADGGAPLVPGGTYVGMRMPL